MDPFVRYSFRDDVPTITLSDHGDLVHGPIDAPLDSLQGGDDPPILYEAETDEGIRVDILNPEHGGPPSDSRHQRAGQAQQERRGTGMNHVRRWASESSKEDEQGNQQVLDDPGGQAGTVE